MFGLIALPVKLGVKVLDFCFILSLILCQGQTVLFFFHSNVCPTLQLLFIPIHDTLELLQPLGIAVDGLLKGGGLLCELLLLAYLLLKVLLAASLHTSISFLYALKSKPGNRLQHRRETEPALSPSRGKLAELCELSC